ncbi:MAG: aldehyde dehydrogenase family protein [Ottowia sp.]|uniref:aldehyde dehydrogenase family protein n=1 Tax=Ottowia sp. TaxID=1898956 RepID=UPI003C770E33
MSLSTWNHFISGAYYPPDSNQYLNETSPVTGEATYHIARGSASDIDRAVHAAHAALDSWRSTKALDRGRILVKIAQALRDKAEELALIEQTEMGKSLAQTRVDIEIAAQYFEFYGGLAPSIEGETIDIGPGKLCYTVKEPYGVVACITPWNAPINQAARAVAPALAAGNTVVAKPSEFTSVSTLRLAEIAHECGLPAGAFNVVTGNGLEAGAPLVSHALVSKIAFTGSLRAGREIGIKAAERIVPVTLELGGKSPDIVFADADLAAAARGAARGFTINAGQACIAGTRILVEKSVREQFLPLLKAEVEKLKVGASDDCQIGPIITQPQFQKVCEFFDIARDEGAELVTGGQRQKGPGYFVQPTVYANLKADSRIAREEIFGPVCAVIEFADEAEAIKISNDSNYGLAAGLWTQNLSRAHRVAGKLQAGQVYINEYPSGGVETPFGGYKQSGIGREKGREALNHYSQLKTVIVTL